MVVEVCILWWISEVQHLPAGREAWLVNAVVDSFTESHSVRCLEILAGVNEPHDKVTINVWSCGVFALVGLIVIKQRIISEQDNVFDTINEDLGQCTSNLCRWTPKTTVTEWHILRLYFLIYIKYTVLCVITATMEMNSLQLQAWNCGTAFQLICDKMTLAFNDLSGY